MADPRDLGVAVGSEHEEHTGAAELDLFFYDNFPGGIGQSEPLFKMRCALLEKARELLAACPCEEGCPSCVGAPGEAGAGAKQVALRLAEELLKAGEEVATPGRCASRPGEGKAMVEQAAG
jgi:DEAD/DEAH box helicase domain-containing protein